MTIALLAHVDAGKTTLSEGMLYLSGSIRKLGRVDKKDAFLDSYGQERERGITIFSKQAIVRKGQAEITLLDTPGHVDFSAEMERTLQVLDAAVLVISGSDGVQGHTLTLWRLLKRYDVPVFLFVNKMDQPDIDRKKIFQQLKEQLCEACVDFSEQGTEDFYESIAVCEEEVLNAFLEKGTIMKQQIQKLIGERKLFPCFFGSALKLMGVEELMDGLEEYIPAKEYPSAFGARVFKITRDGQGNR
ncbi:MAG: GTP-binding protein, partial [Lachnospiraceae bacterium]|nr:GTP-binding protein [Lachnospiraceae bacterium]